MRLKSLKIIRRVLGSFFFLGITLMFLDFTGILQRYFSWMAKIQLLPAVMALNFVVVLALLLLTLFFGRAYCSIICPLGIFQDGVAHVHRWFKKNNYTFSKPHNILRYSVLAIFIVAMVAGVASLVSLLAPYSAYGRMVQNLLSPIYQWGNNLLASHLAENNRGIFHPTEIWMRSLPTFITAAVTFIVIVFFAWRNGRTYCNNICPVGTFLSFFSRFSWLRIHIDAEKCIHCGLCTKNCKASCIDGKEGFVDYSRCVTCGNCVASCPKNAITYCHKKNKSDDKQEVANSFEDTVSEKEKVDVGRRVFLIGSAVALGTAVFAQERQKLNRGMALLENKVVPERKTPVVPAGAKSLAQFRKRCTGCQLCVSQCPNDVLRPSTDWLHLMQAEMSFERGFCPTDCTLCSQLCPTGAILPVSAAEKMFIKKGQAVWIRQNCFIETRGMRCGSCARHCPTGAIEIVPTDPSDPKSIYMLTIDESKCNGCGACEHFCPATPVSAIYVEGVEYHKML